MTCCENQPPMYNMDKSRRPGWPVKIMSSPEARNFFLHILEVSKIRQIFLILWVFLQISNYLSILWVWSGIGFYDVKQQNIRLKILDQFKVTAAWKNIFGKSVTLNNYLLSTTKFCHCLLICIFWMQAPFFLIHKTNCGKSNCSMF